MKRPSKKLNMTERTRRIFMLGAAGSALAACIASPQDIAKSEKQTLESDIKIDVFDARFHDVMSDTEIAETLSTGHKWLEGPAWDKKRQCLYFTDVPENKAYRWSKDKSVSIFQDPSGVAARNAEGFREPGANGLFYTKSGDLILCNHGRRAVELMNLDTFKRTLLVDSFAQKKFNSPNDVVQSLNGTLYFTDPPYGLAELNNSPLKEMSVNGVYKLTTNKGVERILSDMTFPNGIALSPDEQWLYVSQSDPDAPLIRRVNLNDPTEGSIWFDAKNYMADGPGLPDGMAVTREGLVFTSGPTGIYVIHPSGDVLGRLNTGRACANCTFGEDGSTLFITAQDRLLKIRTKVKGLYA
jgi:gluconolactonase